LYGNIWFETLQALWLHREKNGKRSSRLLKAQQKHSCDIAGFLNEVPAHGLAGVMGRVPPYAGQAAYRVEDPY
jgi:hypothetical protein